MSGVRISCVLGLILGGLLSTVMAADPAAAPTKAAPAKATTGKPAAAGAQTFESAEKAGDALVDAAEKFDVSSLLRIVGPQGEDLILTGEYAQDRERSQEFAAQARNKKRVSIVAESATEAAKQ